MRNSKTTQILSYAVVGLLLILYVVPLLLVFNVSLKSFNEYLLNPIGIVQNMEWGNYTQAWSEGNFAGYFANSLIYTVAATLLTIIVSLFAAFPVARGYVMWSGFIYMFFCCPSFFRIRWWPSINSCCPSRRAYRSSGMIPSSVISC